MKVKRLKRIEELEKTIPTENQIKSFKIFMNKVDSKDFNYELTETELTLNK